MSFLSRDGRTVVDKRPRCRNWRGATLYLALTWLLCMGRRAASINTPKSPVLRTTNKKTLIDIRGGSSSDSGGDGVEIIEIEAVVTEENVTTTEDEETRDAVDVLQQQQQEQAREKEDVEIEKVIEEETTNTTESPATAEEVADEDLSSSDDENLADNIQARAKASQLRLRGKELHDEGNWQEAAETFREASGLLSNLNDSLDELATCRLHEALCRLKELDYNGCMEACTSVLEQESVPAAIQARAHHRRAKAKLGLDDREGALQDARSAAFLGDKKAVAFYGKLMRESSSSSSISNLEGAQEDSPALLNDLLQGRNPFLPTKGKGDDKSSALLLESLINKSSKTDGGSNPLSALGDMTSLLGNKKKGGSLAKSVLKSLSKRLDDESTHDTISRYLQNADSSNLQTMASMAGMPLTDTQATKLTEFCHGVTSKDISKTVKTGKRIWYVVSLTRKVFAILSKYRNVIVLWMLYTWIKSALTRPIPISKKAARLAAKAKQQ